MRTGFALPAGPPSYAPPTWTAAAVAAVQLHHALARLLLRPAAGHAGQGVACSGSSSSSISAVAPPLPPAAADQQAPARSPVLALPGACPPPPRCAHALPAGMSSSGGAWRGLGLPASMQGSGSHSLHEVGTWQFSSSSARLSTAASHNKSSSSSQQPSSPPSASSARRPLFQAPRDNSNAHGSGSSGSSGSSSSGSSSSSSSGSSSSSSGSPQAAAVPVAEVGRGQAAAGSISSADARGLAATIATLRTLREAEEVLVEQRSRFRCVCVRVRVRVRVRVHVRVRVCVCVCVLVHTQVCCARTLFCKMQGTIGFKQTRHNRIFLLLLRAHPQPIPCTTCIPHLSAEHVAQPVAALPYPC